MSAELYRLDVDSIVTELTRRSPCQVQLGLFPRGNRRATYSTPSESRSESCVVINPLNPMNLVGASKKFINPSIYHFKLGVIYSFDGGITWQEAQLPMQGDWDGMTDPALAFDDFGNVFLVGEPLKMNPDKWHTAEDLTGLGMVVFRSSDGGVTWQAPARLSSHTTDDKQWVVCDNSHQSPFRGHVYVAWGAVAPLKFARSTDHGVTWRGKGNEGPASTLTSYCFAPEMSVSPDGTLHILWHNDGSGVIQYLRSTDGGNTFEPLRTVVTGVKSLRGNLPETGGWPHFDHGKFRVITLVTDCTVGSSVVLVAWADMREGRSRIYYRRSVDRGATWLGPAEGQPLLPQVTYGDTHCFHPQIIATQTGVVACAFYTFGLEAQHYVIRVQLAVSWDYGVTFPYFITVTDRSWDPLINAPGAHGNPNVHFIGEYFGLDAGVDHFALLWTDTRDGVQELYCDIVNTTKVVCPKMPEIMGEALFGILNDAGGILIVGGKIIKVPPHSPLLEIVKPLMAFDVADGLSSAGGRELKIQALRVAREAVEREIGRLEHDQIIT
jgi:hypothetical protein